MSTLTKTLAEQFPCTFKQIERELAETENRLNLLRGVMENFQQQKKTTDQFEAVISTDDPSNKTEKVFGQNSIECLYEVHKKSERRGQTYLFLNFDEDISVSISPDDIPSTLINLSSKDEDCNRRLRVVWSKTDRGCVWLT